MELAFAIVGTVAVLLIAGAATVVRYVDYEFSKWCDMPRKPVEDDMAKTKKKGRGGKPGC